MEIRSVLDDKPLLEDNNLRFWNVFTEIWEANLKFNLKSILCLSFLENPNFVTFFYICSLEVKNIRKHQPLMLEKKVLESLIYS